MNEINNKNTELVVQNLPRRKAAIYARMSTEHQKYSIENQEAAMIDYANVCNMEISVRYIDDGKSGLTIESRDALTKLIFDIQNKVVTKNDFEVILVLDVSRWGRFQNSDESAYYEYICYSFLHKQLLDPNNSSAENNEAKESSNDAQKLILNSLLESYRFDDMDGFFNMTERATVNYYGG